MLPNPAPPSSTPNTSATISGVQRRHTSACGSGTVPVSMRARDLLFDRPASPSVLSGRS